MGRVLEWGKQAIQRRGSLISPFAVLRDVDYDKTTSIRPLVKMERSKIGKCSSMGTLSAAYDSEIGKFCSIARECYIGGASHPLDRVSTSGCFYLASNFTGVCYDENDYNWHTHTTIGNDVWLGIRTIVLGGVNIADGAVVGAGSVVTKDIGPYEIWAGNPARFIRKRFNDEIIQQLLELKWWDWNDNQLYKYGNKFISVEELLKSVRKDIGNEL